MQQHHSSDFAAGIADRHAYRDHQLAQYGIDLLHDKVLSGKALFHRSFDFRRQSVIVKITGRFGYILLLTHQHPLMSVHHTVLFGQRAGVLTVHFDIFILIDHPHVFHRDIVDITDETAAADTAVTVLQPRHIILQYLGDLRCPHLHLFLFQIQRMLAEKCIKVPPTTKAKISSTAAKYSVSFQAILLRMLFLLETVAYAPNGLDLPLLVFKLIHLGPQALDM